MKILSALKNINGEFELGRLLLVLDMLPADSPLYLADGSLAHTVSCGNGGLRPAIGANGESLLSRQLGGDGIFAPRARAMSKLVRLVFCGRRPAKVGDAVVLRPSIDMRHLMRRRGWFAEENAGDYAMNVVALGPPIDRERDTAILKRSSAWHRREDRTHRIARLPTQARRNALDAPLSARRIVRRERYRLPVFAARTDGSHVALLSRYGQGRALLQQRFRPVIYGRFAPFPQRKTA